MSLSAAVSCRQDDELSFEAGDLLYVREPSADQVWWTASCGTSTGLVPYNYGMCRPAQRANDYNPLPCMHYYERARSAKRVSTDIH